MKSIPLESVSRRSSPASSGGRSTTSRPSTPAAFALSAALLAAAPWETPATNELNRLAARCDSLPDAERVLSIDGTWTFDWAGSLALLAAVVGIAFVAAPRLGVADVVTAGRIWGIAIIALSMVPLIGLSGQLSLCQLSLAAGASRTLTFTYTPIDRTKPDTQVKVMMAYCKEKIPAKHLKGFIVCPWVLTQPGIPREVILDSIDYAGTEFLAFGKAH